MMRSSSRHLIAAQEPSEEVIPSTACLGGDRSESQMSSRRAGKLTWTGPATPAASFPPTDHASCAAYSPVCNSAPMSGTGLLLLMSSSCQTLMSPFKPGRTSLMARYLPSDDQATELTSPVVPPGMTAFVFLARSHSKMYMPEKPPVTTARRVPSAE